MVYYSIILLCWLALKLSLVHPSTQCTLKLNEAADVNPKFHYCLHSSLLYSCHSTGEFHEKRLLAQQAEIPLGVLLNHNCQNILNSCLIVVYRGLSPGLSKLKRYLKMKGILEKYLKVKGLKSTWKWRAYLWVLESEGLEKYLKNKGLTWKLLENKGLTWKLLESEGFTWKFLKVKGLLENYLKMKSLLENLLKVNGLKSTWKWRAYLKMKGLLESGNEVLEKYLKMKG